MANMDSKKLGTVAWDLLVALASDPTNFTNFGGVKALDVTVDTDAERVEIQVHNRASITGSSPLPTMNFQFLENVDANKIAMLTGATVTNVAGTLVSNAAQTAVADSYAFEQFVKIENQNGDGGAITVNSITAGTDGLLVDGTDYEIIQNAAGEYGFYIIDSATVTTVSQDMVLDYDYTPNASTSVETTRKYANDVELVAKIVTDPDVDGKVNTYTLESCVFKGQYKIDIVDLAVAGDLEGTTGTFEWNRGAKVTYSIETL